MVRRTRWLKGMLIGLGALAVLGAGGAVAGRYWIIPAVIRRQIASQIGTHWDGRVAVRQVDFSWSGSVWMEDLDLYDSAGRRWAHAGYVDLRIRNLISSAPVLEGIVTQDLAVEWHYGPGVRPPFKEVPGAGAGGGGGGEGLDLRCLLMTGCSFALLDPNGRREAWEFSLVGSDLGDVFSLSLLPKGQSPSAPLGQAGLVAEGLVLKSDHWMRLTMAMNRRFASDEVAAILAASGWQETLEQALGIAGLAGGGSVDANVTIDLPMEDPRSFTFLGQADLAGWQFRDANGPLVEEAQARVTFGLDRQVHVELAGARLLDGTARGAFQAQFPPGKPVDYSGDVTVLGISMARLNQAFGGRSKLDKGRLAATARFSARSDDFGSFRARAHGVLADADVMRLPVLPDLFRTIGVTEQGGLDSSQVAAAATMAGTTITLERAHLANALSALEAEKGGTIDLKTRQLDLHVVGVPMKQLTPLLNLPVISPNLEKKLTRLHVLGPWTQEPRALIRVEPMTNVAQGTTDFFRSAAEGGGKLGDAFLEGVGEILPLR